MATPLEQAIDNALEQVRVELMRMVADGDVGSITVHIGKEQLRVKALPERTNEPVRLQIHSQQVRPTDTLR